MKHTIEHIQSKLKDALGLLQYDKNESGFNIRQGDGNSEAEESGDNVKIKIPMHNSSDEDENEEAEEEATPNFNNVLDNNLNKSIISTNHVSTIQTQSFMDHPSESIG